MEDSASEPSTAAPPVVAVMVTCVAGDWLEEALRSLANQDYPNLSVLVVDASVDVDPTSRVAACLPGAYVRRLTQPAGYGAAANEALHAVQGASHLLFCHDDVAPEPDAVRLLVEEAFRSNAGVVTPKLVEWERPDRLLQVGMSTDKLATGVALVERGELDQEQHDGVRDVFYAPGACLLIRADLFATIGGFDPAMTLLGEDLDLSWRAQIAGARIVVAPAARVRHLEALSSGLRTRGPAGPAPSRSEMEALQARNRVRTVLKDYGFVHSVRVIPQAMALTALRMVVGVLSGRPRQAADAARAWTWNLRRTAEIRSARKAIRSFRVQSDGEVRRLQVHGSAVLAANLRSRILGEGTERGPGVHAKGRAGRGAPAAPPWRWRASAWGALALVVLAGSRQILGAPLPAVGQFSPLPAVGHLFNLFFSGWRPDGVGSGSPAPTVFGVLGVAGAVLAGAVGLLQKVLVIGSIPVGVIGAYRLARPLGSDRSALGAAALYGLVPVPYNAIAMGHLGALVVYAAKPWLVGRVAGATGIEPFDAARGGLAREAVTLAVLTALAGAFVPAVLLAVPAIALAVLLAGALAGDPWGGVRGVGVAVLGAAGAFVLLAPWSFDLVRSPGRAMFGVATSPALAPGLGGVLRFHTGPVGASPLEWAFLGASVLVLVIGRSWRLGWGIRAWAVALAGWGWAWAGGRGWLPMPAPEVPLALAAAGVALAAGAGVAAFEEDLAGYRFGLRQLAPFAALVAAILAVVPTVVAAGNGRWYLPKQDAAGALGWMNERQADGAFRVLWIGDPRSLPVAGWPFARGLAYGTSDGGVPDARYLWPPARAGSSGQIVFDLVLARTENTTRLGQILAPLAIRYVVLPLRLAPGATTRVAPPPPDLLTALDTQVDLKSVVTDPAYAVYENTAWGPGRELLPSAAVAPSQGSGPRAGQTANLAGAVAVLQKETGSASFRGPIPSSGDVYLSAAASSRWRLTVDGRGATRRKAFGWANAFAADAGSAHLSYRTPIPRTVEVIVVAALWSAALVWSIRRRPRRGRG